jgi:hypothetical protein
MTRTTLVVAGMLVLAACGRATSGELAQPAPALEPTPIVVTHNVPVALSLTVHLVTPSGVRHRLGTVAPGETETFTFDVASGGDFILVAETSDGRRVQSLRFSMLHQNGVRWDVDANRVMPIFDGG